MTTNGKKIKNYFSKYTLSRRITDNEYDALIRKAIEPLFDRALEKTLLDSSDCVRKCRLISGIPKAFNSGGSEQNFKKGKDGYVRYIPIEITILNFTQHEIVIYQCVFDPITENALNESTLTYFYQDIVSIETQRESKTKRIFTIIERVLKKIPLIKLFIKGRQKRYNASEKFILTTAGSSMLEVRLSDSKTIESVGGEFNISETENTIRSIRTMLRDKKQR